MSSPDLDSVAELERGEVTSMPFTGAGIKEGIVSGISISIAVAPYGFVFGVLAVQTGFSPGEATLMSLLVYAGAAQFIAIDIWADPIPTVAIVVATFTVNLRYLLFGAAIRQWLASLPARLIYPSLFMMADENWALSVKEYKTGSNNGAFLFGSGLILWTAWWGSTAVGTQAGSLISDPARFGLDVVFTAVFLTLLVGLWDDRSDVFPWAVAAVVAVIAEQLLGGSWFIVLGGIAGSFVGVIRYRDDG